MDNSFSAIADGTGTATVTVQPGPPSTLTWVIAQFTIAVSPFRAGSSAQIFRNGKLVASSALGSADTAYGPPAISMNSGDQLTCTWIGIQKGDEAILTIWFQEQPYGASPNPNIVV